MTRRVNEFTAQVVRQWPKRFGNFATLPLPDLDGALLELGYAFDTLQVDGVVLMTNYMGKYLGDAIYEPLWEELDRRGAIVFIHPTKPPALVPIEGLPGPIIDYPFDTTRTAVHLALSGVPDRYPKVRYDPLSCRRLSTVTPPIVLRNSQQRPGLTPPRPMRSLRN